MEDTIAMVDRLKYNEALNLPKFKAALNRLSNRKCFDYILDTHSVEAESLNQFVEKAVSEGNAVLIQKEWNGYSVTLWKGW